MTTSTELAGVLSGLGLQLLEETAVLRLFGRNETWHVSTTDGPVVVKFFRKAGAERRLRQAVDFELWADVHSERLPGRPPYLGHDFSSCAQVFGYLDGTEPGNQLLVDEMFSAPLAERVGVELARLHSAPLPDSERACEVPPTAPPLVDLLTGLTLEHLLQSSGSELQAWSLLQDDDALRESVESLLERSRGARFTPVHGDFRLDQLLLDRRETEVALTFLDWEEFRADDPARDVGSFTGEWLYRAVLDITTARSDGDPWPEEAESADVVNRGAAKLAALRPRIEAFCRGYIREPHAGVTDPDFAARSAGFAGWHLLDRLIAGAAFATHLAPIQRAAAGIGRTVLLRGDSAVDALGMTGLRAHRPDSEVAA